MVKNQCYIVYREVIFYLIMFGFINVAELISECRHARRECSRSVGVGRAELQQCSLAPRSAACRGQQEQCQCYCHMRSLFATSYTGQ